MSILQNALIFFLVTNPIGNSPVILALVKDFDFDRQKKILFRESMIALLLALFFQFFGEVFFDLIQVKNYSITLSGGILLFLVALSMIFSNKSPTQGDERPKQEPFIVPIATPILSGPGLMAIIMLKSQEEQAPMNVSLSILIAWIGITTIIALSPYLQKILGEKGLVALEQLMGMILALMATGMIVQGLNLFIKTY